MNGDPRHPDLLGAFVEGSTRSEKALPDEPLAHVKLSDQLAQVLTGDLKGALLGRGFEAVEQGGCWRCACGEQNIF